VFFTAEEHRLNVLWSLFVAQYSDSFVFEYHNHPSVRHVSTHQGISLGNKTVHLHHSEKHLMEQVAYNFGGIKEQQLFLQCRVKLNFKFFL